MLYNVRQICKIDGKLYKKGQTIEIEDPKKNLHVWHFIKTRFLVLLQDLVPSKEIKNHKVTGEIKSAKVEKVKVDELAKTIAVAKKVEKKDEKKGIFKRGK